MIGIGLVIVVLVFPYGSGIILTHAWDYNVTIYNGEVTTFTFPKMASAECIYSGEEDQLVCMRNYNFRLIVPQWKYRPHEIQYIVVNCRNQNNFLNHEHVCVCKTGSQAADPTKSRQHDEFSFCQLEQLEVDVFSDLSELKFLDLSSNQIQSIDRKALSGLDKLEFVSLSDNPLGSLPDGLLCLPPRITFVRMQKTEFVTFPSNSFFCSQRNSSVKHLDLSYGRIRDIGTHSLSSLPNLLSLNLSYNLLQEISENAFYGGINVRHLDLTGNNITAHVRMCKNLPKLEHLILKGNNLESFHISSFSECSFLVLLDLSENNIVHIEGYLSDMHLLQELNLSHNNLQKLGFRESFGNSSSLQKLDISYSGLRTLQNDLLIGLENLKFLNLSGNMLHEDAVALDRILRHPENLKILDLSSNELTDLKNKTFYKLNDLETLDLSFNKIVTIRKNSFDGLSNLQSLTVKFNRINQIEKGAFQELVKLETLGFSNNRIKLIETLPPSLRHIDMCDNVLTSLPSDMDLPNATHLSFCRNSITKLVTNNFINASSLLDLDMSENSLTDIQVGAFMGLDKLTRMNLAGNKLTLNFSVDVFDGARNMRTLLLSRNRISSIDGILTYPSMWSLQFMNISSNPLSAIGQLTVSTNINQLNRLDLSRCSIGSLSPNAFKNLSRLKNVYLQMNQLQLIKPFYGGFETRYNLTENPIVCSCDMKWLKNPYVTTDGRKLSTNNYVIDSCTLYPKLFEIPLRKTPASMFLCKQPTCSKDCQCYNQDMNRPTHTVVCVSGGEMPYDIPASTVTLYLDGNNYEHLHALDELTNNQNMTTENLYLNQSSITALGRYVFVNFPKLKILNLENNLIKQLPAGVFHQQSHLEKLYLNDNFLTSIDAATVRVLTKIRILDISGNKFHTLPLDVTRAITHLRFLTWISIGRNHWQCDCRNVYLRDWMESYYHRVYDKRDVKCGETELMDLSGDRFECSTSEHHMSPTKEISIAVVVAVIICSLVVGFVVYYRRDITALLYTKLAIKCCRKKFDSEKPYDVLVIYDTISERCSTWFSEILKPKLEKQHYSILGADDSPDGPSVWNSPHSLIETCKCSLVVLTEYIDSNETCMKYIKGALEHQKHNPSHSVILAILGDIDLNKLDPEITRMLRRGNYLTVRSCVFWSRLVYELPETRPDIISRVRNEYDNISESEITLYCSSRDPTETAHV